MAHQCLQCGHVFAEGSSAILQGCPQCKGTRFFYTAKPLAETDRRAMADKAQKDLREVVGELLKSAPQAAGNDELARKVAAGGWNQLRPADLRGLMQAAAQKQSNADAAIAQAKAWESGAAAPVLAPKAAEAKRAAVTAAVAEAAKAPEHPDTVNIRKPGEYEIDVAGLLERNPIVVHRDGAYHIHLASLFDTAGKA